MILLYFHPKNLSEPEGVFFPPLRREFFFFLKPFKNKFL